MLPNDKSVLTLRFNDINGLLNLGTALDTTDGRPHGRMQTSAHARGYLEHGASTSLNTEHLLNALMLWLEPRQTRSSSKRASERTTSKKTTARPPVAVLVLTCGFTQQDVLPFNKQASVFQVQRDTAVKPLGNPPLCSRVYLI